MDGPMADSASRDRHQKLQKALEKTVPSGEFSPRGTQQELDETLFAETPSPTPQQFLARTRTDPSGISDTDDQSDVARFSTTSMVPPELLESEETEGPRFEVEGEAGRGGSAYVYRVVDRGLGRTIALKLLRGKGQRKEGVKRRFIHEARVTAMLEHPNIVPVYDIGVTDDHRVFFLMKNVSGVTVGDGIRAACKGGSVPDELGSIDGCLRVVLKVCDALAFAHDKGYVHQDIKPDNIMLGSFGEVLVLDWGCALGQHERDQGKAATFGTPAYMSPEQARQEGADERSDVYCLGATLYHMLTHHHPTWSDDPSEFWEMKRRGELSELPPEVHDSLPEALLALVRKALAPDPAKRHQAVTAFQRAIMEYQSHAESIALAHRAAEQLDVVGDRAEYHVYARITARFEQALEMWCDNVDAQEGLIRARRSHAQRALKGGDLMLAESIAGLDESLSDVRERVESEKQRRLVKLRRNRRMLYAAAALAVMLLALSGYYVVDYFRYFGKWQKLYHADFTHEQADLSGLIFSFLDITAEGEPQPLVDGGLLLPGSHLFWARNVRERGDARVEVCVTWPEAVNGLEIMLNTRREQSTSFAMCPPGYACQFGGYNGTINIISRNSKTQWPDQGNSVGCDLRPGQSYRLWFQRVGEELSLFVDGRRVFRVIEPLPLAGDGLEWVGVRSWTTVHVESFTVWRLGAPRKASPLIAGDALVRENLMRRAALEYRRTAADHAGTHIEERALVRAYLAASQATDSDSLRHRIRRSMEAACPQSDYWPLLLQADCLSAWRDGRAGEALELASAALDRDPHSRVALRMLSGRPEEAGPRALEEVLKLVGRTTRVYGLSLEYAQVSDISTLEGLPIRSLGIRGNSIGDLSALHGMPLQVLLVSANPISDLSPLRHSQLTVLAANGCRISDISPLAGMPLTSVNLSENNIADVSPLSNMPLRSLDISGNRIRSCAPLADIHTLRRLKIDRNPIADIGPLSDLSLDHLNIGETAISSVESLRGMPLDRLNVAKTAITDLGSLASMPLRQLDINGCHITSLEPLAGMPLISLILRDCSVEDLSPLAGMPLRSLDCAGNRIRHLTALKGMPLTEIDMSDNHVGDLSPLSGMPLSVVRTVGNPLTSLVPFEQEPPERFVFDTVVDRRGYADSILARWERSGDTLSARLSRTAIAYRRNDAATLRRLATPHDGHRYIHIPARWSFTFDQARNIAEGLGGHLVTTASPDEHALAMRLLPLARSAWLGIDFNATPLRWLTGEPLVFEEFFNPYHRDCRAPKYLQNHAPNDAAWFGACTGNQKSGLIVEWDR
ncbi:MAG: protein kinase [Chitinivibrionales bacterium]|nr:protein kinase [Chitinivibrionales bacterium]